MSLVFCVYFRLLVLRLMGMGIAGLRGACEFWFGTLGF